MAALLVLILNILPGSWLAIDWQEYAADLVDGNNMSTAATWFLVSLYLTATALLTPFYVGAGFGLYLNARTILEGWDIELAFRRMTRRLESVSRGAAILLVFTALCLTCDFASAQDEPESLEPATAIRDVLTDPDFHERKHKITRYRFTWGSDGTGRSMSWGITSDLTLFLLLVLVCAAVCWLVVMLMRHVSHAKRPTHRVPESRIAQAGISILDRIDAASLPEDVLIAARAAFSQGQRIEALSFLYRGAIRSLVNDHDIRILAGDTESDCLQRLHGPSESLKPYLAELVRAWIAGRYARQEPAPETFETLCKTWPFTSTGGTP